MRKVSAMCAVLFAGVLTAACTAEDGTLAAMRAMDTATMVSLDEAVAIAVAEVPDGYPIEVELELEDDDGEQEPPAWEVVLYVRSSDRLMEVEIHAFDGSVLEVEVEDEGDENDDD